ncbi:DUF4304 domain-containing protein [Phyllobacterium sp. YR531]|uniref:DUF4304 domain-containing protein n=1 Tax=Phyllobacterium sp. YR531 TaxID=1144343 RepID=UPI00026F52DE|nr:DUF4304 domain-containing protein [Phyllobacterium sp. YR531]EJM98701.1 hypothetical protein PMI41_04461 [Phyllobacterium sp. YR531]
MELVAIIDDELSNCGFKKRQTTWYFKTARGVLVLDLQKSAYGHQFYINLASAPIEVETIGYPTPKEYKCPLRLRLDSAYPQLSDELKLVLDLENLSIGDEGRTAVIRRVVSEYSVPFLMKLDGMQKIKRSLHDGSLDRAFVALALGKFTS